MSTANAVGEMRRFNRFYTRAIGVLGKQHLGGPYSLTENRVLYEVATGGGVTATEVGAITGLDAGYLSRIVARFERDGVVSRARSPADGRSAHLRLTPAGEAVFDRINARQAAQVESLIAPLSPADRGRVACAFAEVETLLGAAPAAPVVLRPHRSGDMGWVTERHGVLYAREYGWSAHVEAVTARICADFLDSSDPALERCWIADRSGERLGSVFLVKDAAPGVARLRLLMVEPAGRGLGLGKQLVANCIAFARAAGYREIVLWTHAVLTAARGIYAASGFVLEETWTHNDFGDDVVSETWRLTL